MTHPAVYNTTLCETICTNCGDATGTYVDNKILAKMISNKQEIEMSAGCNICRNTQFLLIVANQESNIIDEILEEL